MKLVFAGFDPVTTEALKLEVESAIADGGGGAAATKLIGAESGEKGPEVPDAV